MLNSHAFFHDAKKTRQKPGSVVEICQEDCIVQTEVCRKGREKELYLISSSKDKGGADKFTLKQIPTHFGREFSVPFLVLN